MKRKWLTVGIILLFIGTAIIPSSGQQTEKISLSLSRGNTLYVGGSGPGNYTKIQDAVNASSDGDTVFVYNDSSPYYENIKVTKAISLVGEDKNSTIIGEAENDYIIIYVYRTNNVTIHGFKIDGNNHQWSYGIYVFESKDVLVYDNVILNCYYCLTSLAGRPHNNRITIRDNVISSSLIGFIFGYTENSAIYSNDFSDIDVGIVLQKDLSNDIVYHNNFINIIQYVDDININNTILWDNSYPEGGNYWDNYNGSDSDNDGIGDTPYNISGEDNQDRYPLMLPYNMTILSIRIQPKYFKLLFFIKNVGNTTAFNVKWNITIEGFVLFGKTSSGFTLRPLLPELEILYTSNKLFIGLGRIEITATAWADNAPVVTTKMNGILILWFFRIIGG